MSLLMETPCTTYEGCIDGRVVPSSSILMHMEKSVVCLFDAETIEEDVFAMSKDNESSDVKVPEWMSNRLGWNGQALAQTAQ